MRGTAWTGLNPVECRGYLAPQVGLEPTTLRLTAECSTIELLRSKATQILSLLSEGFARCQTEAASRAARAYSRNRFRPRYSAAPKSQTMWRVKYSLARSRGMPRGAASW